MGNKWKPKHIPLAWSLRFSRHRDTMKLQVLAAPESGGWLTLLGWRLRILNFHLYPIANDAGQPWAKCNHQSLKVLPGSSSTCRSSHAGTTSPPSSPTGLWVPTVPFGHRVSQEGEGKEKEGPELSKTAVAARRHCRHLLMEGLSQKPLQTQTGALHNARR